MPYASRETASTAAVERRRHREAEPGAEDRERERCLLDRRGRRPAAHHDERGNRGDEAHDRHEPQPEVAHEEPRYQRPDRRRTRERPEREPLLVGTAVEDAIDEHRAAHDGRREAVAGQRRDERRGRERRAAEQPRIDERVLDAEAADDRDDDRHDRDRDAAPSRRAPGRARRRSASARDPRSVSAPRAPDEERGEQHGADEVDAALAPGRLPVRARRPRDRERDDPDRDVHVEHPAPRQARARPRAGDPGASPRRDSAASGWNAPRIAAPEERAGRHPQERQRADHPQRPRTRRPAEQVRGGGRRHRHEDPAARPPGRGGPR